MDVGQSPTLRSEPRLERFEAELKPGHPSLVEAARDTELSPAMERPLPLGAVVY
jgi:hypothetical protein